MYTATIRLCLLTLFLCAPFLLPAKPSPPLLQRATSSLCFFLPPKGWEIADPKTYSPQTQIAFFKKAGQGLCPSINLSIEETTASLSEYLKAVKAIHEQDQQTHWRALGRVKTAAGMAQLTEIDKTVESGPIRLLQLILLKEGHAYILTAAAPKAEFSRYYKDFQAAFRSLNLSSDLLTTVPQLERREMLKKRQEELLASITDPAFEESHLLPFQQWVVEHFEDMGILWQILLIQNVQQSVDKISHAPLE